MERVLELLEQFLRQKWLLIVLVIILIFAIISLIIKNRKSKSILEELSLLEVDYNTIKSMPLTFKLNKARSLAKVNSLIEEEIKSYVESYDTIQKSIERIEKVFEEATDSLENDELEVAQACVIEIGELCSITSENVEKLNEKLDDILKQELKLRSEITVLKEDYQKLKKEVSEKTSIVSFSEEVFEVVLENIDNEFKAFDEWMYISEFDKAEKSISKIEANMDKLKNVIKQLPQLLPKAKEIIPNKIADVSSLYSEVLNTNLYLDHLDVTASLSQISKQLSDDLANLRMGKIIEASESLDKSFNKLEELENNLKIELKAHDDLVILNEDILKLNNKINENNQTLINDAKNFMLRYNNISLDSDVNIFNAKIEELEKEYQDLKSSFNKHTPVSQIFNTLNEYYQKLNSLNTNISDSKNQVSELVNAEKHARDQLLKLYLIINEVSTKINEYQLPAISVDYKDDVYNAKAYIRSIEDLLDEETLNVNLLSSTTNEAIDFIYKLYNNVNNIVGMAIMVENAIVFANRYRSINSDVDSELVKSELYFRNGEYTHALTSVLGIIEKIHPNDYEEKIRENAIDGN